MLRKGRAECHMWNAYVVLRESECVCCDHTYVSMSPTMAASQRILPDRGGVVAVCVNQWHILTQRSKERERETDMIREEFKCPDQQDDHVLHKFTAAGLRLLSPGLREDAAEYASASPPHHRGCTLLFHSGSTREGIWIFATSKRQQFRPHGWWARVRLQLEATAIEVLE